MKTRPNFARDVDKYKRVFRSISKEFELNRQEHLEVFSNQTMKYLQSYGMTFEEQALHDTNIQTEMLELSLQDEQIYIFDYQKRNPLNYNCEVWYVRGICGG